MCGLRNVRTSRQIHIISFLIGITVFGFGKRVKLIENDTIQETLIAFTQNGVCHSVTVLITVVTGILHTDKVHSVCSFRPCEKLFIHRRETVGGQFIHRHVSHIIQSDRRKLRSTDHETAVILVPHHKSRNKRSPFGIITDCRLYIKTVGSNGTEQTVAGQRITIIHTSRNIDKQLARPVRSQATYRTGIHSVTELITYHIGVVPLKIVIAQTRSPATGHQIERLLHPGIAKQLVGL